MSDTMDLRARLLLDPSNFKQGLKETEGDAAKSSSSISGLFGGMGGKLAGLVGVAGVAIALKDSVSQANTLNQQGRIQTQVLKNVGLAQQYNTSNLQKQAESMTELTGQSTSSIMQAQNLLLINSALTQQYKAHPAYLKQATTAAANMAAVTGQTVQMAGKALGRALADPATGMSGLKRYGVDLNAGQELQIKSLEKQNKLIQAQAQMMNDISKSTHGIAEKAANPMQTLMGTIHVLMDSVGKAVLPLLDKIAMALTPIVSSLVPVVTSIASAIGPILGKLGGLIAGTVGAVMPVVKKLLEFLSKMIAPVIGPLMTIVNLLAGPLVKVLNAVLSALEPVVVVLVGGLAKVIVQLVRDFTPLITMLGNGLASVAMELSPVLLSLANAILKILDAVLPLLPPIIQLAMVALVPVLRVINLLLPVISKLVSWLADGLAVAIGKLLTPITWLSGALGDVAKGITQFVTHFREDISAVVNWVKGHWMLLLGILLAPFLPIVGIFLIFHKQIIAIFEKIWHGIQAVWDMVVGGVSDAVSSIVGFFTALPGQVAGAIGDFFDTAFSSMLNAGKWVLDHVIKLVLDVYVKLPETVAEKLAGFLDVAFHEMLEAGAWVLKNVVAGVLDVFVRLPEWAGQKLDGFLDVAFHALLGADRWVVSHVVDGLLELFVKLPEEVAKKLANFLSVGFHALTGATTWVYDHVIKPIIKFFEDLPGRIAHLIAGGAGKVAGAFEGMIPGGKAIGGAIGGIAHGIASIFGDGGIVHRPTLAIVGDKGPEAIVPLRAMSAGAASLDVSGAGGSPLPSNLFAGAKKPKDLLSEALSSLEGLFGGGSRKVELSGRLSIDGGAQRGPGPMPRARSGEHNRGGNAPSIHIEMTFAPGQNRDDAEYIRRVVHDEVGKLIDEVMA